MPIGITRLNARRAQPNDRITFIKPLPGPTSALAQDFLERVAAICNPVMKTHHLSITTLEEYEPNPEFVGRNFNAGEVVQLVLRGRGGAWLPVRWVGMVMMHELAHCKQMNHSGAFWKVRNTYAAELKALWMRGYTGEGMWSRGITLVSGQYERDGFDAGEVLPEHLCGGTYRSSGKRKRRVKEKLGYKEREARRIVRKFGVNGVPLGADEETKVKLEKGKKMVGKPRIAGSARGRELRAAAALARFEVVKEEPEVKDEEECESETTSEDDDDGGRDEEEAVDINGEKMLDRSGRGMVRVCEDENENDVDAQNEMSELQNFDIIKIEPASADSEKMALRTAEDRPSVPKALSKPAVLNDREDKEANLPPESITKRGPASESPTGESRACCPVCSVENSLTAPTCIVCSNVLDSKRVLSFWRCQSDTCKDGMYINAGDCGVCGVCGARKSSDGI